MAVKVASVEFDLVTNVAKFMDDFKKASDTSEKEMKKISASMEKGAAAFKGFGNAVTAGLVVTAAISGLKELASQIDESEKGLAQVRASLNSTGGAAGVTEQQVVSLADSIKKMTSVDDDAVVSMEGVLLTFTKIHKEVFPAATQAIVDLSAKMGQDLQTSAVQVGKALNDPVKGVTALQKIGVSFTESQKEVIKKLAETGHVAEAQKIILRELGEEFGGSAAAARNTFGGALEALNVRIGDVWQSIGGSQGLRTGVEALIIVMEKAAVGVKELSDPTTKMGKDMQTFGLVLIETGKSLMMYTNMAIYGAQLLGEKVAPVFAIFEPGIKKVGDALNWAGGYFQKFHKESKAAFDSGLIPNYFKGVEKTFEEAKKRMLELDALASKSKPRPQGEEDTGSTKADKAREKAAEKAAKEQDRERKSVNDIVRSYELKAQQIAEIDKKQQQLNERIEIERQISSKTNVPLKERLAAINQIGAAYKQMQADEARNEVKKQGESLKAELDTMREQLATAKARKTIEDSMIPIWQAEENLKKLTKGHEQENLALQQQIRDAAKEQAQQAIEEKHQEALKTLQEITDEYEKQRSVAEDKVKGQEDINQLLKDEKKIRENIRLTQEEKDDAVARIKAADAATRSLNKQYEAQKKIIKDIVSSKDSDVAKTKKLAEALANGTINAKEYQDAVDGLNTSASKTAGIGSQLSSAFGNAFNSFISGGSKATDIMKNLGKEIATLAAKKLLLEPLEKMFSNWAGGLFGTATAAPVASGAAGAVGAAATGGIWGAVKKFLGFATGGSWGEDRSAIMVGDGGGPELVWPNGFGGPGAFLAGLFGPEIISAGGGGGYVSNAQETSSLYGDTEFANDKIGLLMAQLKSPGDRGYNYSENQAVQMQINDLRAREAEDWRNGVRGQELRQIIDKSSMLDAQERIAKAQRGENMGGISAQDYLNSYRAIKDEDIARHGIGAVNMDRAGAGAGNQQGGNIRQFIAKGGAASADIVKAFDREDYLFNRAAAASTAGSPSDPFTWLGHSSYKTMGISANNTDSIAYGSGGIWNPGAWGSHYEQGGGYDWSGGAQGQWDKFHNSNLSFGGGNFIGGKPSVSQYDFQGPTLGKRGSIASPSYDDKLAPGMVPYWKSQGYSKDQIDQLIRMNGGSLPPSARVPNVYDTKNEQMDAVNYYKKLTGGTSHPELGTIDGFREYAKGRLGQFAELAGIGGSYFASLYSGGRALGGRVNAGRLYSVAERGDELFMPEKAGNVIPFDKLKGAGNGPAVIINNNALPASDVHVSNQNGKEVITLLKTAIMADPRSQAALESRYGVRPRSAMSG